MCEMMNISMNKWDYWLTCASCFRCGSPCWGTRACHTKQGVHWLVLSTGDVQMCKCMRAYLEIWPSLFWSSCPKICYRTGTRRATRGRGVPSTALAYKRFEAHGYAWGTWRGRGTHTSVSASVRPLRVSAARSSSTDNEPLRSWSMRSKMASRSASLAGSIEKTGVLSLILEISEKMLEYWRREASGTSVQNLIPIRFCAFGRMRGARVDRVQLRELERILPLECRYNLSFRSSIFLDQRANMIH